MVLPMVTPKEQEYSQYIEGKLPVHGGQGILQGT